VPAAAQQSQGEEEEQEQASQKLWQVGALALVFPIIWGFGAASPYMAVAHWHILDNIASVKGSLSTADLASVQAVLLLSRAGMTTVVIAFLCHQQGSSLSELAQLDFKHPWQVLGRGVLTAVAHGCGGYALQAALTYLGLLAPAATSNTTLSAYMQSGDLTAIGIWSASAVIFAPAYEELLFR
jgi:membrane protease YdiL (CAAX protease family)